MKKKYIITGVLAYLIWAFHTYLIICLLSGVFNPAHFTGFGQFAFVFLGIFVGIAVGIAAYTVYYTYENEDKL